MNSGSNPPVIMRQLERDGPPIALLTLNRPRQNNPLDSVTLDALEHELSLLAAGTDVRALIITGAGTSFSGGGDLKGYRDLYRDAQRFDDFLRSFAFVCDALEAMPLLTVAMVNGTCVAGGLELALACDLVVIADDASIGDMHLRYGQLPGAGGSQRLVRAIGVQRARQWLLEGRMFSAQEAVEAGLAAYTFDQATLLQQTVEVCENATRHSPLAIGLMKRLVQIATDESRPEGLDQERELVHKYATTSADAMEGLLAFAERRNPIFEGK